MKNFRYFYSLLTSHLARNHKLYLLLIIPISFLVLLSIRFNGQDFLIEGFTSPDLQPEEYSIDINNYRNYVEFFRSDSNWNNTRVDEPYIYRPVTPFLASFLPFESITSLNIINVLSLAFSLFLIYKLTLGLPIQSRLISMILFIFSFPFIYYGSVGNIDPGSVFFILLGIYLYEKFGFISSIILLPIALIQKEVTILYIIYIAGDLISSLKLKNFAKASSLVIGSLSMYILIKSLFPDSGYIWTPNSDFISDNIYRLRAYISPLLSFGLPTIIVILLRRHWSWKQDSKYIVSLIALSGLVIYAFVSAYVDGRFVFVGISIICIYAAILLERAYGKS